jgi:hypothetical protein
VWYSYKLSLCCHPTRRRRCLFLRLSPLSHPPLLKRRGRKQKKKDDDEKDTQTKEDLSLVGSLPLYVVYDGY